MASPFCKVGAARKAHEGSAISRVAERKLVWGFTPSGGRGRSSSLRLYPQLYKPPARIRNFGSLRPWPAFSVRDRFRTRLRSASIICRWQYDAVLVDLVARFALLERSE